MSSFIIRPTNSDKNPFRIHLTAVTLFSLKLKPGDVCRLKITNPDDKNKLMKSNRDPSHTVFDDDDDRRKLAIAWDSAASGMKDNIVQTSKLLQEVYGFKLGDKITISRSPHEIQKARRVSLRKLGAPFRDDEIPRLNEQVTSTIPEGGDYWAISQSIRINDALFMVQDLGLHDALIAQVTSSTSFRFTNHDVREMSFIEFNPISLGGIDTQVKEIQKIINKIIEPALKQHWAGYKPIQGLIVYGAKGTGKTALIEALADSGWPSVITWKPGMQVSRPTVPCLVIVPSEYIQRTVAARPTTVNELGDLFAQTMGSPTLFVTEVRHPNDVNESLRTRRKFGAEIEIPIPSAAQRNDILLAQRGPGNMPPDGFLKQMSERTHGFVGADLEHLLHTTVEIAWDRPPPYGEVSKRPAFALQTTDLDHALQVVRPSALQEIFLETPNVRWSDIGGQHEIKRQLQNAIDRPLRFADRMRRLKLKPKKGVLLYGPPGCSKTLLVRALAAEAGVNFLAVKGAELISMYVGESEKATREVFRKAQAASPSIIFFDEIDAIASRGRTGNDLNVLTTLLNEMDGFEELRNVFVVAATNKPQVIDPALMRPGRLDNVVYIGPPDYQTRQEIFKKQLDDGVYLSSNKGGLDADIQEFARSTEGFSGAEIVAICQGAGELAFDADRDNIELKDMLAAISSRPKGITQEMLDEYDAWHAARVA